MILAPSTIKLGKSKIRISAVVTIVEVILLIIGGIWMLIRGIKVNIDFTPEAFMLGIVMGIIVLFSSAVFYIIDHYFFNLKMKKLIENVIYPAFSKVTVPEILLIAVLSGFCEEFFFRGILVPEMGIIVSCAIFGILHTPSKDAWFMGLWSTLVGIFFAVLYIKTGNLFVPIVAHAFNNLVAITYIRFAHEKVQKKMDEMKGEKPQADEESEQEEEQTEAPESEEKPVADEIITFPELDEEEDWTEQEVKEETEPEVEEKSTSSQVRLLDPSMLKGKLPIDEKKEPPQEPQDEKAEEKKEESKASPIPEPDYKPMPHYEEKKKERKSLLPDFDTLLGRKRDKKKPEVKPVTKKKEVEKASSPVTLLKDIPKMKPVTETKTEEKKNEVIEEPKQEKVKKKEEPAEKPPVNPVKIKKISPEFKPVAKPIPEIREKVSEPKKEKKNLTIRMDEKPLISNDIKTSAKPDTGKEAVKDKEPVPPKAPEPGIASEVKKEVEEEVKAGDSMDKKQEDKKKPEKEKGKKSPGTLVSKDHRADDIDDEGIGVVHKPQ